MEAVDLVNAIRVVELSAKTRPTAIRALAQAAKLEDEGIELEKLLAAIEEREATAQTIVDEGFAMPHAIIDWDGDYRVIMGRSREGIDYGIADSPPVHLMTLFVVGRRSQKEFHLQLLACIAELLESDDFRTKLIEAEDSRTIERLLQAKVGLTAEVKQRRVGVPRINSILLRHAIELARVLEAQALLVALDSTSSIPWDTAAEWSGRLLVVASPSSDVAIDRPDTHCFDVPHQSLTRMDRANLGLLLAASAGLLTDNATVICLTGPGNRQLDSMTVTKPEGQLDAMFGGKPSSRASSNIRPAVILRALSLAIELAAEGREGKAVGAMFVIGDTQRVLRYTQQLVLNPFHGFSPSLRNLLDPSLSETIKEFAQLDGGFIVRADGMVVSAGAYLVPKSSGAKLPSGLGTRHQAAAAISAQTQAMAITVSQSTGTVTVFRQGQIVLKLERATATRS